MWPTLKAPPKEAEAIDLPDKDVTPAVTEVQNAEGNDMEVFWHLHIRMCGGHCCSEWGHVNEMMDVHALEKAELLRALRKLMWNL